jgi:uncharacterized RDD family membrane protein YckC
MSGSASPGHDPLTDRAAALLHELDSHKSDEPRLAEPMERLTARIVDVCVWLAAGTAWSIAAFYLDAWYFPDPVRQVADPSGTLTWQRVESVAPAVAWGTFIGLILTVFAIEAIPTARTGRHFAKRRLRLRVVGPDGRPPGFRRTTIRWAVCWLPLAFVFSLWSMTLGSGAGFLFMAAQFGAAAIPGALFLTEDHRGFHDRIAGTTVLAER